MALTRKDILTAVKSLFEGDSELLSLVKNFYIDAAEYEKAGVGVDKGYKMFMIASPREKVQDRSQNNDYRITVYYTIVANKSDPQKGLDNIDKIENRIDYLLSNEMWSGNYLTSDSDSTVYDIVWESSDAEVRTEEKGLSVLSEGIIQILINRVKA